MQASERFYLKDIAAHLKGDYTGPPELTCTYLADPHDLRPDALGLCFERRYLNLAERNGIIGCVTTQALSGLIPDGVPKIVIDHPNQALTAVLSYFDRTNHPARGLFHSTASIDPTSVIHASVHIGAHCVVGAGCVIGSNAQLHPGSILETQVEIGEGTVIHSRAVVMSHSRIGKHVRIGPGVVVGGTGISLDQNTLRTHLGSVEIGDHCSIGANSCIDRGTIGNTRLGAYTHLDNLVQVGHNVQIGQKVTICGQVGIAGGAVIGDGVILGGQSGVTQGVEIVSNTQIAAQSGVTKNLEQSGRYSGHPAEPNLPRLKRLAALKQLIETSDS